MALATASLAVPATAKPAAAPQGAEKPKKEPKICRTDTRSGSHIPKTTCKTAKEWAAVADQLEAFPTDVTGNHEATGRAINTGTPGSSPPR
ncbi:MAG: hypothetical protein JO013_06495 [Alphaproteobacteria bacterium]|nr:hypothetical protein [Alphaproteobacteria bacterium]